MRQLTIDLARYLDEAHIPRGRWEREQCTDVKVEHPALCSVPRPIAWVSYRERAELLEER